MLDIVELEIKNLSKEDKEKLYKELSDEDKSKSLQERFPRRIQINKNYGNSEEYGDNHEYRKYFFKPSLGSKDWYYDELDEVLEAYFYEYIDDFISFQKNNKKVFTTKS
ncbi:hypothetical protein [Mesomycoplasma ovipneumoniae]|uniref:hypothetical protein n=1 Tax=Mesomycoplasma ovipneumoniae TaxID=29562 RepID=UPI00083E809F|nr:hypothetical protein [Mesomycoplasma ovipneumoniae]